MKKLSPTARVIFRNRLTIEAGDKSPDGFAFTFVVDVNETRSRSELAATLLRHLPRHQLKHWTIVLLGVRKILPASRISCASGSQRCIEKRRKKTEKLLFAKLWERKKNNETINKLPPS